MADRDLRRRLELAVRRLTRLAAPALPPPRANPLLEQLQQKRAAEQSAAASEREAVIVEEHFGEWDEAAE